MNTSPTRVALGLGSNLGDRRENLARALKLIEAEMLDDLLASDFLESAPHECAPGAPQFLNAAVIGTTVASPITLLDQCLALEERLGRPRDHGYHEDRVIDIDILLYGEFLLQSPRLVLPHAEMLRRDFVLIPLAQIAPDWRVPPDGCTVAEHLRRLEAG